MPNPATMPNLAISQPFTFGLVPSFVVTSDDAADWTPARLNDPPNVPDNSWIYFFSISKTDGTDPKPGDPAVLEGACFVEAPIANMRVFTADQARGGVPLDPTGVPAAPTLSLRDFEFDATGKKVTQFFHCFIATRIQLGPQAVKDLEGRISKLVPAIDLPDDLHDVGSLPAVVPVVDPVFIAQAFASRLEQICDDVIERTTPLEDLGPDKSATIKATALKRMLGHMLEELLVGHAKEVNVKADVAQFAVDNIHRFLSLENVDLVQALDQRRKACHRLARWLDGPLWSLADKWYEERELDEYDKRIQQWAEALDRIDEDSAGRALLARLEASQPFLYQNYIARPTAISMKQLTVAQKAGGAVIDLIKKRVPGLVAKHLMPGAKQILDAINNVVGGIGFQLVSKGPPDIPRRQLQGWSNWDQAKAGVLVELQEVRHDLAAPFHEFKDAQGRLRKAWGEIMGVYNFVTNLTAVLGIKTPKDRDAILADLKVVKGVGSNVKSTFQAWDKLLEKDPDVPKLPTRKVVVAGGVIAALEIAIAIGGSIDAANEGDWEAFTGNIVGVVGAGLGMYAAIFEVGLATGPIGLAAGLLGTLSSVIITFFSDSDLDKFVRHCAFGPESLNSNAQPNWSPTKMSQWTHDLAGLRNQINALAVLCANYDLRATGPTSAQVRFGDVRPESRFNVRVQATYTGFGAGNDLTVDASFKVIPTTGVVLEQNGDDKVTATFTPSIPGGRFVLDMRVDAIPPDNASTQIQATSMTYSVQLDLDSQGTLMVPLGGMMKCHTFATPGIFDNIFNSSMDGP